jgi:hypothetical protein
MRLIREVRVNSEACERRETRDPRDRDRTYVLPDARLGCILCTDERDESPRRH